MKKNTLIREVNVMLPCKYLHGSLLQKSEGVPATHRAFFTKKCHTISCAKTHGNFTDSGKNDSHLIALAFGSNLGNPEQNLKQAFQRLKEGGVTLLCLSETIITVPVDCEPETPDFHNCAGIALWHSSPEKLLELTQSVEIAGGRPAIHSSHQARLIDIDILLFDEYYMETPKLTIPHPRMMQRDFVMIPMKDAIQKFQALNLILPEMWKKLFPLSRKEEK